MHLKEEQLIEACMRNDRKAQREMYNRYVQRMMSIAVRYVGDPDVAKDVVQEAFIRVFTSLGQYKARGSFEGWLRRIVVNAALEYLRAGRVLFESIDSDEVVDMPAMDENVLERIATDDLLAIIASLPDGYRTVFNMYAIEGYSHKEIAERLGINEGSSRSQYLRAKALMQKKLNDI